MAQTLKAGVSIAVRGGPQAGQVQVLTRANQQSSQGIPKMGMAQQQSHPVQQTVHVSSPTQPSPAPQHPPAAVASIQQLQPGISPAPAGSISLPNSQPMQQPPQLAGASGVVVAEASAAVALSSPSNSTESLANTKEKTPMCLINELARFNKIAHQYTLTDEQGPAHKKTFFVKLKLGDEEYAASGASIKKAQHAAAANALEKTAFKHPPPKPHQLTGKAVTGNPSITPTVELNALAMKRGEPAIYRPIEPARSPYYPPPNFDFRGMYNQRYHYPKYPRIFYVSLKVGQREFIGEGQTRQSARHNAAEKAVKVLKCLPMPGEGPGKGNSTKRDDSDKEDEDEEGDEEENGEEEDGKDNEDGAAASADDGDELKSEISLVHEIALRRNLPVNFEVIKESGPPHMRTFVTRCTCGTFVSDGVGNSKKLSKKRCAEKMLEELKTLPTLAQPVIKVKKMPVNKKKNRNLIKKASVDYGVGINPISRLIQIQQAKKEREPVYTLVAERGLPRRREFVIQVTVGDQHCTGVGPNKKLAKRTAAEQMLQLLGYSRPSPQPQKPAIKSSDSTGSPSNNSGDKKVTFLDPDNTTTARQLVPGVLVIPDGTRTHPNFHNSTGTFIQPGQAQGGVVIGGQQAAAGTIPQGQVTEIGVKYSPQTTAAIAKELLDTGVSPTAEAIIKSGAKGGVTSQSAVRPKQQLLYLASVLGFQVEFSDFPKGNSQEYLSLVSLSTTPPKVSHGNGHTVEASHDMAALTALKQLAEAGLDSVQVKDGGMGIHAGAGDGPHVKVEPGEKLAKSKVEVKVKTEPK